MICRVSVNRKCEYFPIVNVNGNRGSRITIGGQGVREDRNEKQNGAFVCFHDIDCAARAFFSILASDLQLSADQTFESRGLSVFLFHSKYHSVFGDQKMSGMEIVFHGQRIATNGDVRLSATPAQWDPIPQFQSRTKGPLPGEISANCSYADRGLSYHIGDRFHPVGKCWRRRGEMIRRLYC